MTFGAKPSDWNMMASSPGESIIILWGGEVGRGAEENTSVARVVSFMEVVIPANSVTLCLDKVKGESPLLLSSEYLDSTSTNS